MTTTILILKGVIALIFTFTGIYKIFLPKDKLLAKGMKGLIDLDQEQIELVGFLEVFGAFGLIMPALVNYLPMLSVISAICLSLTMIVAGVINHKLNLTIIPNIVIFIICILIAFLELKYF
ncbi:MAG TPA: DoxX family protein [Prolixibacteraceae bacterium]|nr:DoxX family protein [Prolixibacteraceae bacterium]